MPIGITNALCTLQAYPDDCSQTFVDDIAVCYLDDILIYWTNQKEHHEELRKVLE